ncbi:MAG: PDZ domain-containing protein [Flavisolibacter sp.]
MTAIVKRFFLFSVLICLFPFSNHLLAQGTMLLREPTISKENIVFVHGDDLWVVSKEGGEARRLTTALGSETNPKMSPDGKWVAFSGQYDNNTDVYIIPIEGGDPKRLTWHPGNDIVQGWTPDGKEVIFSSTREFNPAYPQKFYKVSVTGGTPEPLIIPFASNGSLSADGEMMAYEPYQQWDPIWRNYRGGQAQPIWIFDMRTHDTQKTPRTENERHFCPAWDKDVLYFISEKDYAGNVWSYNVQAKALKQLTFHKDFDVKNIAASNGSIVYEQGGYLHLLDISSGRSKQLEIHATGDMNYSRARWNNVVSSSLMNASLSPTGKRAIFEYRGEIFTVPKEHGDWRNITRSTGAADRYPAWSPDGQKIAWFSDVSGEYQLMIGDQEGLKPAKAYTIPNKKFYYFPSWSPDGKSIAFTDTDYNLWVIDVANGELKKIATDHYGHPNRTLQPSWSPDSKYIAYVQIMDNQFKAVKIYNMETGATNQLTDGMSDCIDPKWDESGKYLYFLASTDYGLGVGWLDMSSYNFPVTRALYIAVLSKDIPSPLESKSDDETAAPSEKPVLVTKKTGDTVKAVTGKPSGVKVKIDFDGIDQRIVAVNIPQRNYAGLIQGPEGVIFISEEIPNEQGLTIHQYNLKELKNTEFVKGVSEAQTSFDRKTFLYRSGPNWFITGTIAPAKPGDGKIATDGMKVYVDPAKEAEQIYREGWRFQRDFLYVDNVHGAPWDKVYNWYKPWVAHVKHRSDLNYILEFIGGEVSIGHSFVFGGDYPEVKTLPVGLLGADYQADNGYFKIKKIYSGENWNPNLRSPLSGPGINVKEGEYLLEVDGRPLSAKDNIYSLFEGTAGRQIKIRLNEKPAMEGSHLVTVVPVANDRELRVRAWVEGNRKKVAELSAGKLAYVYVPNTAGAGYEYFNRYYFSQIDKKGAVIDERYNQGGSIADYMIDVMNRKLLGYFNNRVEGHKVWTAPDAAIWGPKVMIINENAGSGGDMLPYMFRKTGIGPLVGTRTWGGLVGIWDTPLLMDGGFMTAPRGGFFDTNGNWAVEGQGIEPDIEVFMDPKQVIEGKDPQLERAVKEAMNLMPAQGIELKKEPPPPIRYRRPETK